MTEVHNMTMDNGVMRMRKSMPVRLAPGESISLEPGGLHIMVMNLSEPFKQGDTVILVMNEAEGESFTAEFKVGSISQMSAP